MEIAFRHNGVLYNQCYAWMPKQMSSGAWVWLTVYYTIEVKGQGWVSMSPWEFMIASTKAAE